MNRLEKFDRYNKENHVHYVQIENYLDKFLRLKVQHQIGKSLAGAFENKRSVLERYRAYEEGFLKEANKAILGDDGQPEVMESMHRDFLKMLQGALTIKEGELVSQRDRAAAGNEDKLGPGYAEKLRARTSAGQDIYISLKDYVVRHFEAEAEDVGADGASGLRTDSQRHGAGAGRPAGKLLPDIDFDRVVLDKQRQFDEFLKMWSALNFPE